MTFSFNLVDQPWLTCRTTCGQRTVERSLLDVLLNAQSIQELGGENPLVLLASHRILLAVLHRVVGPVRVDDWECLWNAGRFPEEPIRAYLQQWRHRFDLFDLERPFYQAPVGYERVGSVARMMFQADNNPTLFDHTTTEAPPSLTPAAAARHMLAYQAFDFGGIKSAEGGRESAKAAPLNQCAVVLVRGRSLFETLMLNLHRYDGASGSPFQFNAEADRPAWEREQPPRSADRFPDGYLDLLTWQSRRVFLRPDRDGDGQVVVRAVVLMKGEQPPASYSWRGRETMVAFRPYANAKEGDPWPPLKLDEERLFFRDSLALVQSASGGLDPPAMIHWLKTLMDEESLTPSGVIPLDVVGFTVDRAKPLFWRHERFPLPVALLVEACLVDEMRLMLDAGESIGKALGQAAFTAAELLLSSSAGEAGGRTPDRGETRIVAQSFAIESGYWSRLETAFYHHLQALASASPERIEAVLEAWTSEAIQLARCSFEDGLRNLDHSGRSLKALTRARRRLDFLLQPLQPRSSRELEVRS